MALITCPECGKQISDKALACPNCGAPINLKLPIPVTFVRPKAFANSLVKVVVYVDSLNVGILGNGQSFDTELTSGRHVVEFEAGASHSASELFIPDDANKATVEISVGALATKIVSVKSN